MATPNHRMMPSPVGASRAIPAELTPAEGRKVLRAEECAELLRCNVRHIYDLVEEGKIRAVNISGGNNLSERRFVRIPVSAWAEFIHENLTV